MAYSHSSFEYAGSPLDGFVTEDGRAWVTMSSIAKGLGQNRQSPRNWLNRANIQPDDELEVKVGAKKNVLTTAYPISIIGDYLDYLADRGDVQAKALLSASFRADLERTVKETNGIQVTVESKTKSVKELYSAWVNDDWKLVWEEAKQYGMSPQQVQALYETLP